MTAQRHMVAGLPCLLRPFGDQAVLVEPDPAAAVQGTAGDLARNLREQLDDSRFEVVPGARAVLVRRLPTGSGPTPPGPAPASVAGLPRGSEPHPTRHRPLRRPRPNRVVLPVRFDGPDLAAAAQAAGMTVAELVGVFLRLTLQAQFVGFAPGFAYLGDLPPALRLPRLAVPRIRVPAGSVAIADRYCGVYPRATPGGWHLIGSTGAALFDAAADPPALLSPGTLVGFELVP